MAAFNLGNAGDISSLNDFPKIQSYLYKLNEQLRYMFDNLSPEDNYNDQALLKYVSDGEKQSAIEVSLEQISLSMVDKDNVVAAINMSKEGIQIQADKIKMEGLVTVNSYFKIGLDGSIEAKNGKFSGHISASTMDSSEITLGGNGKDGKVIVKNSQDVEIGRWSKDGIDVKQGSIRGTAITVGGSGTAGSMSVQNSTGVEIGRWDLNGLTMKNASGQVIGQWNANGINVLSGSISGTTITAKRGNKVGFYADGTDVKIGDFYVEDWNGRQVLQSEDLTTGISGTPTTSSGYYMWAGWESSSDFIFVVEASGNVIVNGGLFINGFNLARAYQMFLDSEQWMADLDRRVSALEGGGE